ncbi:DUF6522 family protein [Methylobacterium sp. PvR107]|uniref:DUF6522 family protein n=1 Tax=Methylobacterium sp. PvR107 TaxID=2806597 RepID=UPI001FD78882|nr:DUF6522 family protein [Methylobacterium sp. PvR107]
MRLNIGQKGDWLVDPRDLSSRLGVNPTELKRLNRTGRLDSRIASGHGEDEDRTLITIRLAERGWRGIFDRAGTLVREEMW